MYPFIQFADIVGYSTKQSCCVVCCDDRTTWCRILYVSSHCSLYFVLGRALCCIWKRGSAIEWSVSRHCQVNIGLPQVADLFRLPTFCSLYYRIAVSTTTSATDSTSHRRRRRRAGRARAPPPKKKKKFGKKYFSGNYYVKFGHFSGKNRVKFGNFVNFSGKYNKNSGILIIFGQESCKIQALCEFFIHIFREKMSWPPKVDWAPTPMALARTEAVNNA